MKKVSAVLFGMLFFAVGFAQASETRVVGHGKAYRSWFSGSEVGQIQVILDRIDVTPESFQNIAHLTGMRGFEAMTPAMPADCEFSAADGTLNRQGTSQLSFTFEGKGCEAFVNTVPVNSISVKLTGVPADHGTEIETMTISIE